MDRRTAPRLTRYAWVPIIVLYAFVASRNITLPGLYYDEAFQNVSALAFAEGGLSTESSWVPESEVSIFGHEFPLMSMAYIGGVKTAAFAPVAAVAGVGPRSVRYFSIAFAALALIGTFQFTRRLFGPVVATVAGLLIATDPSFIAFTRVDYGPNVFMFVTKMAALWLLAIWWTSGRRRHLFAACFMLGLGTYDKANFLWIVGATVGAGVVVAPLGFRERLTRSNVLAGALGFCIGAGPFIWYNLRYPLAAFDLSPFYIANREPNATMLERIWQRIAALLRVLNGEAFPAWGAQTPVPFPVIPVMLALAIVAVAAHALWTGRWREHRPFGFVVVSAALTLLASASTRGGGAPHHVILVYPLPQIALACGIVLVATLCGSALEQQSMAARAAAIVFLVGIAALSGLSQYRKGLGTIERNGGFGIWSTAIYELNDYLLSTARDEPIVAADWGIHIPLVGLSQGVLRSHDMQGSLRSGTPAGAAGALWPRFDQPGTRYVLHSARTTVFKTARTNFLEAAQAQKREISLERTFSGRDGLPVFEVYRVSVPPPLPTSPAEVSGPAIVAVPNPVPAGDGAGTTTVHWDTKSGSAAQVYFEVTWNGGGQAEKFWGEGASGTLSAPWINAGATYEFRLYAGTDHRTMLSKVAVTRAWQPASTPKR